MRLAIYGFAVAVVLADCGGRASTIDSLPVDGISAHRDPRSTWISPNARNQRQLLFVSDLPSASVAIFALPRLNVVGTITGFGEPQGLCADRVGNVWVADTGGARVYEYSHSGVLLNTIWATRGYPASCAVNPRNGKLAVLDIFSFADHKRRPSTITGGWAPIEVYACPSCSPVVEVVPGMREIFFGAYDNRGTLYVDGLDDSGHFQIGALPRGHDMGHELELSGGEISSPGMVQWYEPGHYLAVGDQKCNGSSSTCINWVSVSGVSAKITGQTHLETAEGTPVCDMVQGVFDPSGEKTLLGGDYGCNSTSSGSVDRWRYPAGGLPIDSNGDALQGPVGSALSVK